MTVERNMRQLVGGIAEGLVMLLAGIWLADGVVASNQGEWTIYFGWATVIFGVCATALQLWRIFFQPRVVLTLSPAGLTDTRISPDIIPWSSVQEISTLQHRRHRNTQLLVVRIDCETESKIKLSWPQIIGRRANLLFAVKGLTLSANGINFGFDQLRSQITAYAKKHNPDIQISN